MPTFIWEGKTKTGESRNGAIDAKNADEVTQKLKAQGVNPTKVKRKGMAFKLPSQQFRFEVARNTPLAPLLMGTVVANALRQNTGFMAESTLLVPGCSCGVAPLPGGASGT